MEVHFLTTSKTSEHTLPIKKTRYSTSIMSIRNDIKEECLRNSSLIYMSNSSSKSSSSCACSSFTVPEPHSPIKEPPVTHSFSQSRLSVKILLCLRQAILNNSWVTPAFLANIGCVFGTCARTEIES